ncbi:MAG: hypothetical protein HY905_06035 [Deltaproteobacteria bacterium]|nr:hypothetical protein [Deltaproteobacteria bacterium]
MKRMVTTIVVLFVLATLVGGCPNNGPGPVEPDAGAEPAADVAAPQPEIVAPPPPPPAEYTGDPGTLIVEVTFNGAAIDGAEVRVHRTGQEAVETSITLTGGQTEASFELPPGRYDVSVPFPGSLDGAADGQQGFRIETGRTKRVTLPFDGVAQVTLQCSRNGHNTNGTIRLRRQGATDYLPEVRCQQEFFIGGGTWEAEVTIGSGHGGVQVTTEVHVQGGGSITTPIMIQ